MRKKLMKAGVVVTTFALTVSTALSAVPLAFSNETGTDMQIESLEPVTLAGNEEIQDANNNIVPTESVVNESEPVNEPDTANESESVNESDPATGMEEPGELEGNSNNAEGVIAEGTPEGAVESNDLPAENNNQDGQQEKDNQHCHPKLPLSSQTARMIPDP